MKRDKKSRKIDKKHKPEAHQPVGKSVEKEVLGEKTRDIPGKAEQQRKLKTR
ncbi:MAG: hypothetical protein H0X62_05070 [Bacteroidetes bacterium]|nr:hypothetical protein [Bacteroidota bacterium]